MNEASRVRCVAARTTEPDVLIDLSHDPAVTVRAALAMNPAAPAQANELLASDPDERVRILLARKLAALAPSLSAVEQAHLYHETWETLRTLVADEAVRVRALIADAIKELPNVPREVALRLAGDTEVSVYEPVIRLSPLLTAEDLVALVANAPGTGGTLIAVACRAGIAPAVSDAIAASTDPVAIRALLANPAAQIREATLDALVARSVDHPEWHEPLVRRPALPAHAARVLAQIVATHLLEVLANRTDVTPALREELRCHIADRLAQPPRNRQRDLTDEEAMAQAQILVAKSELNEDKLVAAARYGDLRFATALLAVSAGLPVSVVDRAASLRSAKGVVSLVWKAGFTMRVAIPLQTLLARLPPDSVLTAGPSGSFPLAVEEMRWQLDFLGRMGR